MNKLTNAAVAQATYPSLYCLNIFDHVDRVREMLLVPDEILVFLRVFDIKPEDINWYIIFIKALLHASHIIRADVVPATLVITESPMGWKERCSS